MELCSYKTDPIKSLASLSKELGVDLKTLIEVSEYRDDKKYRKPKAPVFKSDGAERRIMSPCLELRKIQKQINRKIFRRNVKYPSYVFGSVPRDKKDKNSVSQDYISAASVHCSAKTICKLDVSDFFDNVHRADIYNIFNQLFRYSDDVSEVLTKLVTFNNHLVQGALTSSFIAMLVFWDDEPHLVDTLSKKGIRYSRLVDDITLSSKIHNYNFELSIDLVNDVLKKKGLCINSSKKNVKSISTENLTVHGLNVNFNKPCLPKDEAKRIKSAVRALESAVANNNSILSEFWYREEFYKTMGRVYKLERFGKSKAFRNLLNRLKAVQPIPSTKDLRYTRARIKKLISDYEIPSKRKSFSFKRRFDIAFHRVLFLGNVYKDEADSMRKKMEKIQPEYKV